MNILGNKGLSLSSWLVVLLISEFELAGLCTADNW